RRLRGACGDAGAERRQRLGLLARTVPQYERPAGLDQAAGLACAHETEAEKGHGRLVVGHRTTLERSAGAASGLAAAAPPQNGSRRKNDNRLIALCDQLI